MSQALEGGRVWRNSLSSEPTCRISSICLLGLFVAESVLGDTNEIVKHELRCPRRSFT